MPSAHPPADSAISRAATLLAAARRVLVTGFHGLPTTAVLAACDLAEALSAAIDVGDVDAARPTGPMLTRVGEVTADPEELQDRADLVVFWFCDPEAASPGFVTRFVTPPPAGGRGRRTIAVGPAPIMAGATGHRHLPLPPHAAVDAARQLQLRLRMPESGADATGPLAEACRELATMIESAACAAFVTDDSGDRTGVGAWSLGHLVRQCAHHLPAFEVPLRPRSAIFETVCTWRYGAAGGVALADRSGAEWLPAEAVAERLVARGEVDAVLVVGGLVADVERALAAAGSRIAVVRLEGEGIEADLRALRAAVVAHRTGGLS